MVSTFLASYFSFFPDAIQPFLMVISNAVFAFLVKLRICRKPERRYDVSAPTTITVSLPGTDPQDAERRRYVCQKSNVSISSLFPRNSET